MSCYLLCTLFLFIYKSIHNLEATPPAYMFDGFKHRLCRNYLINRRLDRVLSDLPVVLMTSTCTSHRFIPALCTVGRRSRCPCRICPIYRLLVRLLPCYRLFTCKLHVKSTCFDQPTCRKPLIVGAPCKKQLFFGLHTER